MASSNPSERCSHPSASYPPTEYLDLSFLDFVTFNVYLHNRETFRRYLFRVQNTIGDKPLVLGELGIWIPLPRRRGNQANFLGGHVAELRLMGLAGSFVFSWTDETGTRRGSYRRLGIWCYTTRPVSKNILSCAAIGAIESSSPELLAANPRVSVVVCTFNGARTLRECLESLKDLDYPDYEVIVVDDGSTDDTRSILEDFPEVRTIHQENLGLSMTRNVGLAQQQELLSPTPIRIALPTVIGFRISSINLNVAMRSRWAGRI